MRILMTTDTVGGVLTYALDLCRALERFGVEVVLAAMGPRIDDEQRAAAHALPNVRLELRPDDHAGLAAAIERLAVDEARRRSLAARARLRAASLGDGAMARAYLGLYSELVGRRATSARPDPARAQIHRYLHVELES